jgi:hypothetical protein
MRKMGYSRATGANENVKPNNRNKTRKVRRILSNILRIREWGSFTTIMAWGTSEYEATGSVLSHTAGDEIHGSVAVPTKYPVACRRGRMCRWGTARKEIVERFCVKRRSAFINERESADIISLQPIARFLIKQRELF